MIFCVTVTDAFLPRAKVLARSVKRHHPDSRVIAGYFESRISPEAAACAYFDDIVLAADWGHPHFEKLIFQHPVYAAQCALRPAFLKYMLYAYPGEKIVCLGADTKVYSPLKELEAALDRNPMVLTTHHLETTHDGWYRTVGMYNGDLLAFRNGEEAHRYCDWMSDRMMRYCYVDIQQSMFLDQPWLKFAPVYFGARALMHPGYNIAFWNIYEPGRRLWLEGENNYRIAGGDGLRFFHFSNLPLLKEELDRMSNPALNRLYEEYMEELRDAGGTDWMPWSYDFYESGESISLEVKGAYGISPYLQTVFPIPRHCSNEQLMQAFIASQTARTPPPAVRNINKRNRKSRKQGKTGKLAKGGKLRSIKSRQKLWKRSKNTKRTLRLVYKKA